MTTTTDNIQQLAQQYGQAAVQIMRQIATYLSTLQVERPELFADGTLVNDWLTRLQDAPLPPQVLPEPEPLPTTPIAPKDTTPIDLERVTENLKEAIREFGEDALAVMHKIAAFLTKLQMDRPDLFENGILIAEWMTRIQSAPLPPQILPEFDPNLLEPDKPKPVRPTAKPSVRPTAKPSVSPPSLANVGFTIADLRNIAGELGQQAAITMRQIAEFLTRLKQDRPDLFDGDELVQDWELLLKQQPLSADVLPKPNPEPPTPAEPTNNTKIRYEVERIRSAITAINTLTKE